MSPPLLSVQHLTKTFPLRDGRRRGSVLRAVTDVSFTLRSGETLSLVGESGCGKSTTARCVMRLTEPTSGSVLFDGVDLAALSPKDLRSHRRHFQMVFQDPQASLNPRMTVRDLVAEPCQVHGLGSEQTAQRVLELADLVQLDAGSLDRFPHEFSGGQRQRIGIARALALSPRLIALDEPVSALDVSIQAEIIRLLERLRDELDLAYLFIAHDLSVVRHLTDRVAVMYLGSIVEQGSREQVYAEPAHPYTQALLSAAPIPDPPVERSRRRLVLAGDVPDPADPPSGCAFRSRCWKATEVCAEQVPELLDRGIGHPVACHHAEVADVLTRPVPST